MSFSKSLISTFGFLIIITFIVTVVTPQEDFFQAAARTHISKTLKAPSTAKWVEIKTVKEVDPERAIVWVLVDAQNGFGAMMRRGFCVKVTKVGPDKFKGQEYDCDSEPNEKQIAMLETFLWE